MRTATSRGAAQVRPGARELHARRRRTRTPRRSSPTGTRRGARLRVALGLGPPVPGHPPPVPVPGVADDAELLAARTEPSCSAPGSSCCRSAAGHPGQDGGDAPARQRRPADARRRVGWYEREFDATAVPFNQRGRIFEENLDADAPALDAASASAARTAACRSARADAASPRRGPGRSCSIGGYVDRVLRRVAERSDGWLTYFYEPRAVQHGVAAIRGYAEEAGRDPAQLNVAAGAAVHRRLATRRPTAARATTSATTSTCRLERGDAGVRGPRHARAVRRADRRPADAGVQHLCSAVQLRARAGAAARRPRCCRCSAGSAPGMDRRSWRPGRAGRQADDVAEAAQR